MAQKISVGIDIGTHHIKVVVAENAVSEDGHAYSKIIGTGSAESKGLRHGYITNLAEATKSIRIALNQAEKLSKIKIKKVYVSIGGMGLGSIIGKGSVVTSKADSEITDLDVKNVLAIAESELPHTALLNKKIVTFPIPLAYKIDDELLMGRPSGMHGTRLEARVLFITCLEQHLNDFIKAVEKAGVDVIDVTASPLAGSIVSLSKTQRIAGCVLVNIGSESTSLAVFENDIPISIDVLPVGGNDITNDIALNLRIPIDEAERLKIGTVSETQYPKKKLDDIVANRLSDIFDLIETHLKKIGRNGLLPAGVILTGGGSNSKMVEDIARATLKLPAKIAPINLKENSKGLQLKDSSWSVAYGLSVWGLNNEEDGSLGFNTGSGKRVKILEPVGEWFKQFLP